MRNAFIAFVLLSCAVAACGRNEPPPAASPASTSANASTTVGGATLQTSTVAIADLNDAVAARYGIDRAKDGLLLLVTVRDAAGNGIDPGDLQLTARAGALPEPPRPLELRTIRTGDMTDYIGVFAAKAPATVRFQLSATRAGARADIASTAELLPR